MVTYNYIGVSSCCSFSNSCSCSVDSMAYYKTILLVLYSVIALGSSQKDASREPVTPGINYCEVIEAVVEEIESSGVFTTDTKGLLRLIAFIETRDGERLTAAGQGGIWKVSVEQFTKVRESRNFINIGTIRSSIYNRFKFNFADEDLQYNSLDKPFISALFAALYLYNQLQLSFKTFSDIPPDPNDQSTFYARYYSKSSTADADFKTCYQEFESYTCVENCTAKTDIVILMDGSGSVRSFNFRTALKFMSSLVSNYDIGLDETRVGVVVYSNSPSPRIQLNSYFDVDLLQVAIESISYPSGGTNTGEAIDYVRMNSFTTSFGARDLSEGIARVLIVATDGQSGDDVVAPSERARNDGINIFAIGIGTGIDEEELRSIADSPNQVFLVSNFNRLLQITFLIRTSSCKARALVKVGKPVSKNIPGGEVTYLSIPIAVGQPLSIKFTGTDGNFIIYASYTHRNPGPNLHDFIWFIKEGTFTVSTPSSTTSRRRRQSNSGMNETLYVGVMNVGNDPASIMVDLSRDINPNCVSISSKITEGNDTNGPIYNCSAACVCSNATVMWEKKSFDRSIQPSAKIIRDSSNRSSLLQLDTSTDDHYGQYYCVIRSPCVIGSKRSSLDFPVPCQNGGTNVDVDVCSCREGWDGLRCERGE